MKALAFVADRIDALRTFFRRPHPSLRSLHLPKGYRIQELVNRGHRSGVIGKDNALLIMYDIGTDPIVYWDDNEGGRTLWLRESFINGMTARIGLIEFQNRKNLLVSFHEVHVTFYAWVETPEQESEMLSILATYRWAGP
jgi:hypothetical protein